MIIDMRCRPYRSTCTQTAQCSTPVCFSEDLPDPLEPLVCVSAALVGDVEPRVDAEINEGRRFRGPVAGASDSAGGFGDGCLASWTGA